MIKDDKSDWQWSILHENEEDWNTCGIGLKEEEQQQQGVGGMSVCLI